MLETLFTEDPAILLGAFGFIMGIASLIYARSQARGAHAQVESARKQAAEALLAAELVAKGAREQAAEALLAAELVAQSAREQAVEALRAAGLVAENAREQAAEALRAAELVAKGARAQAAEALRAAELVAQNAREQALEALRAAGLVAENARAQAVEALRAAGLVAENARVQAVQALDAAGLVAENARLQAAQALRAAELLANTAVAARVRDMRTRYFQFNRDLPVSVQAMMKRAGGPDAYGLLLDAIDIAQEIYLLRKDGVVSDDHWRMWMNEQIGPIAASSTFKAAFEHAAKNGGLPKEFAAAFDAVFAGGPVTDPWQGTRPTVVPPVVKDGEGSKKETTQTAIRSANGPSGLVPTP